MGAVSFEQIARRFGLGVVTDASRCGLRRHDQTAWFSAPPPADRHAALCICLGARLGLDLRAHAEPRGVGVLEWTQRLYPGTAIDIAEAVADTNLDTSPWLRGAPFEVVFTRESEKLLIAATRSDDVAREDARRALFYAAYKLRPATTTPLGDGKLLKFETTGGLGSSLGTLFPDFDYDASRDHGVLALPGYDRMLVFHPGDAPVPWAELRRAIRAELADAPLPFSRRLYSLRRDCILPGEVCGPWSDHDAAHIVPKLLEVVA